MQKKPILIDYPYISDWISLKEQNRIIVFSGKVELGQNIFHALTVLVADELNVRLNQIEIQPNETGLTPNEGLTAGSMSMSQSGDAIRKAAITLRELLLTNASNEFEVSKKDLQIKNGIIFTVDNSRFISFWDLMVDKNMNIPIDLSLKSKPFGKQEFIGKRLIQNKIQEIIKGERIFIQDLEFPDMLHARIIRPPQYHSVVKNIDHDFVLELEKRGLFFIQNSNFIAIAGKDEYRVVKASEQFSQKIEWLNQKPLDINNIYNSLENNDKLSFPVNQKGIPLKIPPPPLKEPPNNASLTITALYEKPYLMHGAIGPSAACAIFKDSFLKVWSHSQGIYQLRESLAVSFDMETENIKIYHIPGSGCYGHNGADDAAYEAVLIAFNLPGIPILLKWTRSEEHCWEPYGTAMTCKLRGSINKNGKIIDWSHESYGDTFMNRPNPDVNKNPHSKFVSSHFIKSPLKWPKSQPTFSPHGGIHRNIVPYYNFKNNRLIKNLVQNLPLRTSSLRSLGAFMNIFSIESFLDELSYEAEIDPVKFRLDHLDDERAKETIRVLDEMMKTDKENSDCFVGSGIAFGRYKNTAAYSSVGIELEVNDHSSIILKRAWITADVGEIIDPDGVTQQLEGGLIQAASWTLYESVAYDENEIISKDWENYPIMRFDNIPNIKTVLINQPTQPFLGCGETVAGPTAAAISNALFNAIGIRLRRMPFTPDAIQKKLLSD